MSNYLNKDSLNFIDYDNVDENKSRIKLQKIEGTYFIIYEFQKFNTYKDTSDETNYVVLGRFYVKENEIWKTDYEMVQKYILSLIKNYLLPFDLIKSRKIHDMNLRKFIFNNDLNDSIINRLEFTQEGFDLITNKFLFTGGKIERTIMFDNSYNHYDELVKSENFKYFKKIEFYYYNYFFNDNELNNITLDEVIRYVDFNKLRLENVIIANSNSLQQIYFSLNDWKAENEFLVTFVDSQIELRKNGIQKEFVNIKNK